MTTGSGTIMINRLPTRKLRVKRALVVSVTKKGEHGYTVDLRNYGLELHASASTPEEARNKLAEALVKQYFSVRDSRQGTEAWTVRNKCRNILAEINTKTTVKPLSANRSI